MMRFCHILGCALVILGVLGAWIDPRIAPAFTVGIVLVIVCHALDVRRRARR